MHWYENGFIIAIPFILIFGPAYSWVLIFRPAWAIKFWGAFGVGGLTPQNAKWHGIINLVGNAAVLIWILIRLDAQHP